MTMEKTELSDELKQAADDMVARRMKNTGETRQEASQYIAAFFKRHAWI